MDCEDEFPGNFSLFRLDYRPAERVMSLRSSGKDLDGIESVFKPDAVFTTSGSSYWRPRAPDLMGFNLPHHPYPESPFFSQVLNSVDRLRWWVKSRLIHHYTQGFADAGVVQTDVINQRLRQWIPSEQVFTVPNTISSVYLAAMRDSDGSLGERNKASGGLQLLVLSARYRQKNLEIINDIVDLMRKRGIDGIRFTVMLPHADCEKVIRSENCAFIENVGPHSALAEAGQAELQRFGTSRQRAEAYLSLCIELVSQSAPRKEMA